MDTTQPNAVIPTWLVATLVLATTAFIAPAHPGPLCLVPDSANAAEVRGAEEPGEPTGTVEATQSPATVLLLDAPQTIRAKATATVVAILTDTSGTPVPGAVVRVVRLGTTTTTVRSGLTDDSGRFSVTVTPQSKMVISAVFDGDAEWMASRSAAATIRPKVLLSAPWTHDRYAYPGQRLPARGTLWPKHSKYSKATVIVCERLEGGRWVKRAQYSARMLNTETRSRYDSVIKLTRSGSWRIRAVHVDDGHARTVGPVTKVKVIDWRRRYRGAKTGGVKTTRKMVAITIDDGPNRRTLEMCSILEKYGGRGTFFFTDALLRRGYSPQAKKAYDRGHEIANHTANHKMLYGYSGSLGQVTIPKRSIRAATGFDPIWVRAMGGGVDSAGMSAVVNSGQLYCNWSIDSYDSHRRFTPPSVIYRNVVRRVRPGDVILIHQTHPESIQALPGICRELRRRGYKMVTLSELAATGGPR
jgi:peptidoglycan/xylan/chitin deacetylase (PgdA/CDA1 family)